MEVNENTVTVEEKNILEYPKAFNWGAFGFSFIWGLFHKCYITLLFIPCMFLPFGQWITLGLSIWFGVKGNEWAWNNKKWKSIEHFNRVQSNWAIAFLILFLLGLFSSLFLSPLSQKTNELQIQSMKKYSSRNVKEIVLLQEALGEKCVYTTQGLTDCFEKRLNVKEKTDNKLVVANGAIWTFSGNGLCEQSGDCTVKIDVNGENAPNVLGEDIIEIPLYRNNEHLKVNDEDIAKYEI